MTVSNASASVKWDGPVDAAIDGLASFLQRIGLQGAGVRPFGYGFTIEKVEVEGGGFLRNRKLQPSATKQEYRSSEVQSSVA